MINIFTDKYSLYIYVYYNNISSVGTDKITISPNIGYPFSAVLFKMVGIMSMKSLIS